MNDRGDLLTHKAAPESSTSTASDSAGDAPTASSHTTDAQGRSLHTPLKGFFKLAPGQAIGQAIGFAVLVLVARKVGPSNLGTYQFAVSALTYFSLVANLGITTLAVRDVTTNPDRARAITGDVLVIRLTFAALSFASLLVLAPYITPSHRTAIVLDILGVALIIEALTGEWLLQAYQRLGTIAIAALLRQITVGVLTALVLTVGFVGVERYAVVTVVGTVIASTMTAVAAIRVVGSPHITFSASRLYSRCRRSTPFSWSFIMIQVYYTSDYLLLGFLKNSNAVGQYGAAYRLPSIVIGVISLWSTAAYPYLVRRGAAEPTILQDYVSRTTSVALLLAAALLAITFPLGHALMLEIFGAPFAPAAPAFVILMANAGVIIASVNLMNVLLAVGDERHYAIAVTGGAVANTALNFALIPSLGTTGSATATLCAEMIVFFYMLTRARRITGPLLFDFTRLFRGLGAALMTGGILFGLHNTLPAVGEAGIGGVTFIALALSFRVLTLDELLIWRHAESSS